MRGPSRFGKRYEMLELTPTKLKRLYNAMSAIASSKATHNPFKGAIYFYNGCLYATDSFSIVRVELSWAEGVGEYGHLYVVEDIDDKGHFTIGEDAVCERYNASGHADTLARMFEPDMTEPESRVGSDCKYLLPVLKCFNALKLPVTFSQDSKRLFMSTARTVKFERYQWLVRMDAIVMHVRLP